MFMIYIMSMIILIISVVVMMLATLLSKKTIIDREKSSPFECGFDPSSSSRLPFSLQFFLIAIIFLIFDVEIALMLPIIVILKYSSMTAWASTIIIFIIILIVGIYHEWNQGALNWSC